MLNQYVKKRNFQKTPEPKPSKKNSKNKEPIFVVQKHHASHLHYDLRLEFEGVLKSWAVPKGPSLRAHEKRLAMLVEDHPLDYAHFEGVIPKGNYGAGPVIVWDQGTYTMLHGQDFASAFSKGDLKFFLHGKKLKGEFALVKMETEKPNTWLLIKKDDQYASSNEEVLKSDHSVISKKSLPDTQKEDEPDKVTLKNIPKGKLPRNVRPMLATLVKDPFDGEEWIFEIKWDGYRAISQIDKGNVTIYSRNLIEFSHFGPMIQVLKNIKHDTVLDGEIVVLDRKGLSQFQLLQDFQLQGTGNLTYYLFDILHLDGHDLQDLPLIERKRILEQVIDNIQGLQFSSHVPRDGVAFFAAAKKAGLEGIVAKNGQSTYQRGKRGPDWLKIKIISEQEAVIGGFTKPRGSRQFFGALVLGVYEGDELVYIGHTGGGFTEEELAFLQQKMQPLVQKNSPFKQIPKTNQPVQWVKPQLVCQIKFQEWTKDNHLRQPIFLGLREDKNPKEVHRELPKV